MTKMRSPYTLRKSKKPEIDGFKYRLSINRKPILEVTEPYFLQYRLFVLEDSISEKDIIIFISKIESAVEKFLFDISEVEEKWLPMVCMTLRDMDYMPLGNGIYAHRGYFSE